MMGTPNSFVIFEDDYLDVKYNSNQVYHKTVDILIECDEDHPLSNWDRLFTNKPLANFVYLYIWDPVYSHHPSSWSKYCEIHFAIIWKIIIFPVYNFAHVPIAELTGHVPKCDLNKSL